MRELNQPPGQNEAWIALKQESGASASGGMPERKEPQANTPFTLFTTFLERLNPGIKESRQELLDTIHKSLPQDPADSMGWNSLRDIMHNNQRMNIAGGVDGINILEYYTRNPQVEIPT